MTKSRGATWLIAGLILVAGAWALLPRLRHAGGAAQPVRADSQPMAGMPGRPGMDMPASGGARLTAAQLHQFGVTFGTVDVRPLTTETRSSGVVTFDERHIAQVASKIGGVAEKLYVNSTGQAVQRGEPLLELYSPDLLAAETELLLAEQLQRDTGPTGIPGVPAASTSLVDAARRRLRLLDIAEAQIDEVLRTRRTLRTLTLYAPSSGVVVEKRVVEGQAVAAGERLYTVSDLSEVWVELQLRGEDAATARVGTMARIEIAGMPGHTLNGRIAFVYPALDSMSRTVRARIALANADGTLKPGMYATARITTPARSALAVPNSAILRTGDRNVVFVDIGDGMLMPHDVTLGQAAAEYAEVLAGLTRGQRVVTSAQFLLDSESNLGEVMKAMISQQGQMGVDMKGMPGMKKPPERR